MTMQEAIKLTRELAAHPRYVQHGPYMALDNERGEWYIKAGINWSGYAWWVSHEILRTPEAVQRFIARYLEAA